MTHRAARQRQSRKRDRRRRDRTAAERVRRWRARQREGRIVLKLEVDEINISQGLLEANLLDPLKAEDPHAIAKALEQFIDQIFCVTA